MTTERIQQLVDKCLLTNVAGLMIHLHAYRFSVVKVRLRKGSLLLATNMADIK